MVLGVPHELFEEQIEQLKQEVGAAQDTDLSAEDLKELVQRYKVHLHQ